MERGAVNGKSGVGLGMHCFGKGSGCDMSVTACVVMGVQLKYWNKTKAPR